MPPVLLQEVDGGPHVTMSLQAFDASLIPPHGRSGWFSQTWPVSSQVGQVSVIVMSGHLAMRGAELVYRCWLRARLPLAAAAMRLQRGCSGPR